MDGGTYTLGNIYNATNFSVTSGLNVTPTAISISVATASPVTSHTWKGGFSGGNNVWALGDGGGVGGNSNWTTDGVTATGLTPGTTADILFTSANSPTNQTSMALGANMAVRSLTVSDTGGIVLNDDGNALRITNAAGITVNGGAGAVTLHAPITLGAAQTWTNNSSNLLTIGGDINNGANLLTIAGSGDTTIQGQIRYGTGGLTMNGTGTLTLNGGSISWQGSTTVNSGIVKAGNPFALGMAISNTNGFTDGWGYANVAFGAGSTGKIQLNGNNAVWSSLSSSGGVGIVENASSSSVTLAITEGTATRTTTAHTYSGILQDGSGGGSLGLHVSWGALTISGNNTYSGTTTISGGTIKVGSASNVIPNGSGKGDVVLVGNTSVAGTFDLNNFDETINGLSGGAGAVLGQVVNNSGGALRTLTVGDGDASASFAGLIKNNTVGTGTIALTKIGTGTQTLAGANTYTGDTLVNAGTLLVTGSIINNDSTKVFVAADSNGDFASGFDTKISRNRVNGAAYAGYGSAITSSQFTAADLLAGTNTSGSTATLGMQWRTLASTVGEGNANETDLIGDVLNLTGIDNTKFVLQMSYTDFAGDSAKAAAGELFLSWLDAANSDWVNAIDGNNGTNIGTFQGDVPWSLQFDLGDWGADSTGNVVWAVLDHNSQFSVLSETAAAVPEPSTFVLAGLGLGGLGCLALRKKRRRN